MRVMKSSEDYLETMLIMKERHGYIRSVDVATELGVTKPSVSHAVKRLRENGYVTMEESGLITLTDKGMEVAVRIYERHKLLTDFIVSLGVDPVVARQDACKIEHDISEETFDAMCRHFGWKRDEKSK